LTALGALSDAAEELSTHVIVSPAVAAIFTEPLKEGWVGAGLLRVSLVVELSLIRICNAEAATSLAMVVELSELPAAT
jgi:hypothetical protein